MIFTREPYQDLLHDFLVERRQAAGFAGIGIGKTATTLGACRTCIGEGDFKAALVIAPMRVANLTWPNEIKKWDQFKSFRYEHLRDNGDKPSGKSQFYFTNYDRLMKTVKYGDSFIAVPRFTDLSFCSHIIFDELTRAKSHTSDRINALRPLIRNHVRWGLTGTPRPNSLLELFAQIRLLDDGKRLGPSFDAFRSAWCEPADHNEYKWKPKPGAEEKIYQRIHDLVITLRSSDYLNIPDTVVEDIEVPLPQAAHSVYRTLERELMVTLMKENETIVAVNAAVLVGKLLQVCSGSVYSFKGEGPEETRVVSHIHQSKMVALKKTLLDRPERAIIASNFIHERDRIVAQIPGAVDAHKFKGDIEDAWNSGQIKYLVADPRGLGHGLNLQEGGRWTIWFSPCHSRELYDQFNGRTARKGQVNPPIVTRITCPGTIDDATIEALRVRGDDQAEMMAVLTNFRTQGLCFS